MNNFLVWCLQVLALVTAGAALTPMLRGARVRLWFWQGLLALALALPFVERWHEPLPELASAPSSAMVPVESNHVAKEGAPWWSDLAWLDAIAAGAVLRWAWLGLGMWRLQRLRRSAQRIEGPVQAYEAGIEWFVSEQISGPVTFGWPRASILLPAEVLTLPQPVQEAIGRHELRHAERSDWLYVLAEEIVRGLCWFHPAVWFALSRIQLAREQVVDREVIEGTGDRAGYLEALLAVASRNLRLNVAPAPLFLKKRQLTVRVAALQEESMSQRVLMMRTAIAGSVAALVVIVLMALVPFESAAQSLPDGQGITVATVPDVLHRTAVTRPTGVQTNGTVMVDATLNAQGVVTDARVVNGPDELRKSVLASLLEWHFAPTSTTARVTVTFGAAPTVTIAAQAPPPPPPPAPGFGARGATKGGAPAPPPPPPPPPPAPPYTFGQITFNGVSATLEQQVRQKLGFQVGQTVNQTMSQITGTVRQVDEHLVTVFRPLASGELGLTVQLPTLGNRSVILQPQQTVGQDLPANAPRIATSILNGQSLTKVPPIYPPLAKEARVQGVVKLDVLIGTDGHVQGIRLLDGPPLLVQAATDAVQQWTYKPYLMNGQPTAVIAEVNVNFTLLQ